MTLAVQNRFHHEVIRNLDFFKLPLSVKGKAILSVMSEVENLKDLWSQVIHKNTKKQETPVQVKPNFQNEEGEFTCKLIKTNEELLSLFNTVDLLRAKRDLLVHQVVQKNIPLPNEEQSPISKRYGINLDRDPNTRVGMLFESIKQTCLLEQREIMEFAGKYKESELIQDIATILQARIAQKGLLQMQQLHLLKEVNQLLEQLK